MAVDAPRLLPDRARLRAHLPEYTLEAAGLALFMLSASAWAVLLEHPASPVRAQIEAPALRRAVMGLAMGLTSAALVYSPIGARSGGHFNPATTLAFFRLGRVHPLDAGAYAVAQVAGGLAGIVLAAALLAPWLGAPPVRYVATVPGAWGWAAALVAEAAIAAVMMTVVLHVSSDPRRSRYTGACAAVLVAIYITIEAPVSGMSLNPARSLGPALLAGELGVFWIYAVAPPLGMLAAAERFSRTRGADRVLCAKLHHHPRARCIFNCRVAAIAAAGPAPAAAAGAASAPATTA